MRILLVNDDGIQSPGLKALALALAEGYEVTVAAPDGERSAVGHGITLRIPLFAQEVFWAEGIAAYSVSGTPADCTRLGLDALTEGPVDLVISGLNAGPNTGMDLLYSGTVSAALEAAMLGVKAMAVSAPREANVGEVVKIFLKILEQIDIKQDIQQVLNINIPALPLAEIKGARWTPQGFAEGSEKYEQRITPDGRQYYWPTIREMPSVQDKGSDIACLKEGYVSLTPLTYSLTDPAGFRKKEFCLSDRLPE